MRPLRSASSRAGRRWLEATLSFKTSPSKLKAELAIDERGSGQDMHDLIAQPIQPCLDRQAFSRNLELAQRDARHHPSASNRTP